MVKNIDEIFSPERIRRNWNQVDEKAGKHNELKSPSSAPSNAMAEFDRLQALIHQRFPGEQSFALDVMMEELHCLLKKRFPEDENKKNSPENTLAFNQAIEEILNQIEDLVEALEL